MNQSELIKKMSDRELNKQLLFSHLLLLFISLVVSFFLFERMSDWLSYFNWNIMDILYYGVVPGFIILAIDLILIFTFPKKYYDDGGINDRIFKNKSIGYIFYLSLAVAISEELLFRGVIQSTFGYVFASILFVVVHFRYLTKPVLLISVLIVSFYIGFMFEITGNLLVTITAHFIVDFILGLVIRFQR